MRQCSRGLRSGYETFTNIFAGRETEPEAFFLDVFFNAHPTVSMDPKQKQKASNALIPSTMAYPGGYVDFTIEMGDEVHHLQLLEV